MNVIIFLFNIILICDNAGPGDDMNMTSASAIVAADRVYC